MGWSLSIQDQIQIDAELEAAQAEVEAACAAYSQAQDMYSEALEAASKAEILCASAYSAWMNSLSRLHQIMTI
jgi:hypothetical protein